MVTTLPYGSWPSSISAEQLAVGGNRLSAPLQAAGHLWWSEGLAAEGGRQTIVRTAVEITSGTQPDNPAESQEQQPATVTLLPAPFNARSRVHEYGGACWTVLEDEDEDEGQHKGEDEGESPLILFVNFSDQRIYRFREGQIPEPISPLGPETESAGGPSLRWAEPVIVHQGETTEVWWVCEDHTAGTTGDDGAPVIRRYIASVPLNGSAADDLSGIRQVTPASRFVAGPRVSPDGRRLAWISWEHPQMPWDGTQLHLGRIENGAVTETITADGGTDISVLQPEWADEQTLVYLSDRSGWWNVWKHDTGTGRTTHLLDDDQEYAGPLWQLGQRWLTLVDSQTALVIHGRATDRLGILHLGSGQLQELELPHTAITGLTCREDGLISFYGASASEFPAICAAKLEHDEGAWSLRQLRTVKSSREDAPDSGLLPTPEPITVRGEEGQEIHAVLYRPHQEGVEGPEEELPPYIAQVHGGPTGQAAVGLSLATAYYTSRGIGVVDINYGGSTGFGRAYRDRLKGQWGVVDVEDTVAVMEHLVEAGIADGSRLGIEGGSAGGWTTLACLTRSSVFGAGISSYGVADLVALAEDTHDFESRYLDQLVGPYPDEAELYRERAPLNHVEDLNCPVLLLQGDEDPIVPPNQAEMFRDALAKKSIPHAYLLFSGEQHGFRKAENIIASYEASLSFYGQVFGFEPAGIPRLELTTG